MKYGLNCLKKVHVKHCVVPFSLFLPIKHLSVVILIPDPSVQIDEELPHIADPADQEPERGNDADYDGNNGRRDEIA